MTEFFTRISGQITGPIILGAFFPVVLFTTALALLVLPITPYGHTLTSAVKDPKLWQEKGSAAIAITFVVLVLSVVLYNLNIPIIRLYEGYPWLDSWIGQRMKTRQQLRFDRADKMRKRIRKLRLELRIENIAFKPEEMSGLIEAQRKLGRLLNDEFPDTIGSVLPTKLGNVIRAFETYTTRQYGAPAIALWPRLQGIVESTYAQALDAIKTSFDFMIHSSFLSAVLAVLLAGAGLVWQNPAYHGVLQPWMAWSGLFVFLSYLFYLAAINRAAEWGMQVKATFDLYRLALLSKLGYELKPADLADERRIWEVLNYKFAFPDDRTYPDLPYRIPSTYLVVEPVSTIVAFTRTVSVLEGDAVQVRVSVSNTDPTRANATQVVLREDLTTGKSYVRGSAMVDGATATLLGLSPLQVDLGPMPYYETRTVVYTLKGPGSSG